MRTDGDYVRKRRPVISVDIPRWWRIAAASCREPGGRRTRCLKKSIFRRPEARGPERADAETEAKRFAASNTPQNPPQGQQLRLQIKAILRLTDTLNFCAKPPERTFMRRRRDPRSGWLRPR